LKFLKALGKASMETPETQHYRPVLDQAGHGQALKLIWTH